MAEALLKKILVDKGLGEVNVNSAGISVYNTTGASENAVRVMESIGIDISSHRSKQITESMINEAGIILTMTRQHKRYLQKNFPLSLDKVYTLKEYANRNIDEDIIDLDIIDPYGLPIEYYHECAKEIENCLIIISNNDI